MRAGAGRRRAPQRVGSHEGGCQLLRGPVFLHRAFQPAGVLTRPLESQGLKALENLGRQVAHCQSLSTGVQGALGDLSALDNRVLQLPPEQCHPSRPERFLFSQVPVLQKQPSERRAMLPTLVCVSGVGSVRLCHPEGRPPSLWGTHPTAHSPVIFGYRE